MGFPNQMILFVVYVGYVIVLEVNHNPTMLCVFHVDHVIVYEIYRDQTIYYSSTT